MARAWPSSKGCHWARAAAAGWPASRVRDRASATQAPSSSRARALLQAVQVDQAEAVAVDQHVAGMQVAMQGRGWTFRQLRQPGQQQALQPVQAGGLARQRGRQHLHHVVQAGAQAIGGDGRSPATGVVCRAAS